MALRLLQSGEKAWADQHDGRGDSKPSCQPMQFSLAGICLCTSFEVFDLGSACVSTSQAEHF
jgi:hypothetical protein